MTERKKKLFRDILDVCKRGCLTARFGTIHFKDDDNCIDVYTGCWYVAMYSKLNGGFYVNGKSCHGYSDEMCEKFFDTVSYYRTHVRYEIDWEKRSRRLEKFETCSPKFF